MDVIGKVVTGTTVVGRVGERIFSPADAHATLGMPSEVGQEVVDAPPPSRWLPLRVAAIYSGRWMGPSTPVAHVQDHLKHFIRPNRAHVFLGVDPTCWCDASREAREAYHAGDHAAAEVLLVQQARRVFEAWPQLYVALVPSEAPRLPHEAGMAAVRAAVKARAALPPDAPYKTVQRSSIYLHKWFMQYDHLARTEALRRVHGPHDVVVRLRLEVLLGAPLVLEAGLERGRRGLEPSADVIGIHYNRTGCVPCTWTWCVPSPPCTVPPISTVGRDAAAKGGAVAGGGAAGGGDATSALELGTNGYYSTSHDTVRGSGASPVWLWSDWLQIGSPQSMGVLAGMTATHRIFYSTNTTVRCAGLCQEEQNALQLEQRGVKLVPLPLPLRLIRFEARCGTQPLVNATQRQRDHDMSPWYAPCPYMGSQASRACPTEDRRKTGALA